MRIILIRICEIILQEDNGKPPVPWSPDRTDLVTKTHKGVLSGIPLLGKANKLLVQEIQLTANLSLLLQESIIPTLEEIQ